MSGPAQTTRTSNCYWAGVVAKNGPEQCKRADMVFSTESSDPCLINRDRGSQLSALFMQNTFLTCEEQRTCSAYPAATWNCERESQVQVVSALRPPSIRQYRLP